MMDNYRKLCTLFYDLDKPVPPTEELAFYREYCLQANGPIHEAMCGSGRFLIPLFEEGFDIDGSDASSEMLGACHRKCSKVRTFQQSLSDLDLPRSYDLIFIPSGSFSLITNREQAQQSLEKLRNHLLPTGKLYVEVQLNQGRESHGWPWGGRWIDMPDGGRLLLSWLGHYDAETSVTRSLGRYDLISPEGKIIETEIEPFDLRYYGVDEFKSMLNQAGFNDVERLKSSDESTLVFLAGGDPVH